MPAFHINSFKGLSDYDNAGIKGSFKLGYNIDVRKKADTLSNNYELTQIGSGVIDEPIYWFLPEGVYVFAVGRTKIFRITVSDNTVTEVYSGGTNITGAKMIYHSNEKLYIYWADGANLHRKEYPGLANWSDVDADAGWPKTNLDSGMAHPMEEVSGSLLIGNGSRVAYVGYDQSYSNEVLRLPLFNIVTCILDRGGRAVFGTRQLLAGGINAMVDFEVPIFVGGGSIYYNDFNSNVPIATFPGGKGEVLPGAISVNEDTAFKQFLWEEGAVADPDVNSWIMSSFSTELAYIGYRDIAEDTYHGIYTLGRKEKNKPFVLNFDHMMGGYPTALINHRTSNYDTRLYVCDIGGNLYVKSTVSYAQGFYSSLDLSVPDKLPSQITTWKFVEIISKPMTASSACALYYTLNKSSSTYTQARQESGSGFAGATGENRVVFFIGENANIFSFDLLFTEMEITDIYIYFD